MMTQLAIIIPAYKADYLEIALESIVNQTNKNFKVYIGDDASPYHLESIVEKFSDKMNIVYRKFETNLGGTSLTKQWERCVDLSNENWIWLFSDDDVMSPTAVETFYNIQKTKSNSQLFKFHTKMLDADGREIRLFFDKTNKEKNKISSQKYLDGRLSYDRFRSYMVEYIFHRDIFLKHRFVDLPLAWVADDATWLTYSIENNGIDILPDFIYWRFSGKNISSDNISQEVTDKKLLAVKNYVAWLKIDISNKVRIDKQILVNWTINQVAFMFSDESKFYEYLYKTYSSVFTEAQIKKGLQKFHFKQKLKNVKDVLKSFMK